MSSAIARPPGTQWTLEIDTRENAHEETSYETSSIIQDLAIEDQWQYTKIKTSTRKAQDGQTLAPDRHGGGGGARG